MVTHLNSFLAALSLARREILWEFARCPDSIQPFKKLDQSGYGDKGLEKARSKKAKDTTIDVNIGKLMEETVELQSLLLSFRSSICIHLIDRLKASYQNK